MSLTIALRKNYKITRQKIVEANFAKNSQVNFQDLSYDKFHLADVDKYISVAPAKNAYEIKTYHKIVAEEFVPQIKSQEFSARVLNLIKKKCVYFMSKISSGKTEVIKNIQNEIIGGLKYEKIDKSLHIYSLAVKKNKRKGKGRENILMQIGERLKKVAKEKNVENLSCDVLKNDKHLIKLYTNVGFFPVGQNRESIHMECPVNTFCRFL